MPRWDPAEGDGTRERIGVFGGTFDPPHIGHLSAAVEVGDLLGLDRILLTVANHPWQKLGTRGITPAHLRLEMVRVAVADLDLLEASDLEIRRGGDSYTVDTLVQLRRLHPDAELFVILGADAAALIPTWGRAEELWDLATVVAYERVGDVAVPDTEVPPAVVRTHVPRLEVSSTEIRRRVVAGRPIDVLCPAEVIRIITAHGLYRDGNP